MIAGIIAGSIYAVSLVSILAFVLAANYSTAKDAQHRLWELEKQVANATVLEDITYEPAKDDEELSRNYFRRR